MEFLKVPGSSNSLLNAAQLQGLGLALLAVAAFVIFVYASEGRLKRWSGRRRHWPRRSSTNRAYWSKRRRDRNVVALPRPTDVADPAQQMNHIAKVGFETVPLLNREEFRVYVVLEKLLTERRDGCRLMAQTSLGEIIRPKLKTGSKEECDLAFRSINSKRLDFAIFDRSGRLTLAIEYQGSGHYHQTSFIRDAVKKEALRKAGVPLLEVPERFDPQELAEQVRRALPGPSAPRSSDSGPVGQGVSGLGTTSP